MCIISRPIFGTEKKNLHFSHIDLCRVNEMDFEVFCMSTSSNATNIVKMHSIDSMEKTIEAKKLRWISGYENSMVSWFDDDEIEIRSFDIQTNRTIYNRKQFINVTSVDEMNFGNDKHFIAICANIQSMGHDGIDISATVDIYRFVFLFFFRFKKKLRFDL